MDRELNHYVNALFGALSELYGGTIYRIDLNYADSGIVSYRVFTREETWPLAGEIRENQVQTVISDPDGA